MDTKRDAWLCVSLMNILCDKSFTYKYKVIILHINHNRMI